MNKVEPPFQYKKTPNTRNVVSEMRCYLINYGDIVIHAFYIKGYLEVHVVRSPAMN